jgi:uncharacterized repeat protein (TIGR03803 family)
MKKLLIYVLFIVISSLAAKAQYADLFDFSGKDGVNPEGSLIYDGKFLYGICYGGVNNDGVIFRIKPDGTGDTNLHNLDSLDGKVPLGTLFTDGNYLYGVTQQGGIKNNGVVFRIKPNGTGDTILHYFDSIDGRWPEYEVLISDGTYLYGTTWYGGKYGNGVVFRIKTNGTAYSDIHDFDSTDGKESEGTLYYDGNYLYGMTWYGGKYNLGVVFRMKPDGTGDTSLLDFNGANGSHSHAGPLISDGKYLYGMTVGGGKYNEGVVFRIKPDGTADTILHNFSYTSTDGGNPSGGLLLYDSYLYGMTPGGGTISSGVIFRMKTDGTRDTILHDFVNASGTGPDGSLILVNNALYGLTQDEGAHTDGVIFKYVDSAIINSVNELPVEANVVKVYPNPGKGVFILEQSAEKQKEEIEIYNVLGQKIFQHSFSALRTTLDLSGQPADIYFYRIISEKGDFIASGKLIKE